MAYEGHRRYTATSYLWLQSKLSANFLWHILKELDNWREKRSWETGNKRKPWEAGLPRREEPWWLGPSTGETVTWQGFLYNRPAEGWGTFHLLLPERTQKPSRELGSCRSGLSRPNFLHVYQTQRSQNHTGRTTDRGALSYHLRTLKERPPTRGD